MKAKDLRGKNIEDIKETAEDAKDQDDQVAAAYENISKRLESIRNGKSASEEESEKPDEEEESKDDSELDEWKGPKPPKEAEVPDEDEDNLRKVNLRNLEDEESKKSEDEEGEREAVSVSQESEEENLKDDEDESKESKKDWEPEKGDPLDDELGDSKEEDEEDSKESDAKEDEKESLHSEKHEVSESSDMPGDVEEEAGNHEEEEGAQVKSETAQEPDTLDDLAEESPFARKHDEDEERHERREDELPYDRDSFEDESPIRNLKASRQENTNMGYNANPQRESVGSSYSPKGSYMEGNDPNNFFSQHQPPKRANKFHLLVLVVIGIVVIGFTVYILKGGFGGINLGTSEASPSPSATATPEPTPTPTPEPEVDRSSFTIRVLNGTSTTGLAKTVSDKLKELGYETANPGNASENDVEQTEIRVKEGTQSAELFERLKLDLAPDYEAKQGENLDEDSRNDAEVIVGGK